MPEQNSENQKSPSESIIEPHIVPNIYQKILAVMSELDYIQKGSNKVNNQYSFVSHDQVTAKVHPLLVKYRLAIIPTVEEMKQDANRTVVKLNVVFVNVDCPSDAFSIHSYGYGIDSSDKGPGKAISYAYKYALLKTFCLETGDDPDNDVKATYEPAKCLEFETAIPMEYTKSERKLLLKFLEQCASASGKQVEEVKKEALTRMDSFLEAFKRWSTKQD